MPSKLPNIVVLLGLVAGLSACQSSPSKPAEQSATSEPKLDEADEQPDEPTTATPPQNWVDERVEASQKRLESSEAGTLVWQSIQAHGGLDRWFSNGPLYFRFTYEPLGDRTTRDTYQTIDTWSSRARHQLASDRNTEFGWDGEHAWVAPDDAEVKVNARFWALTPYYFVAMPFVLADPGVNLELVGDKELRGQSYRVVKATFASGTGDAPDDYYVLYFEPDTKKVAALRYVVSYPGFFPEGGHSPEKLMIYDGEQTIDGINFAKTFPTHKWDTETQMPGKKVTAIEMSAVEFRSDTPSSYFEAPEHAKLLKGY